MSDVMRTEIEMRRNSFDFIDVMVPSLSSKTLSYNYNYILLNSQVFCGGMRTGHCGRSPETALEFPKKVGKFGEIFGKNLVSIFLIL